MAFYQPGMLGAVMQQAQAPSQKPITPETLAAARPRGLLGNIGAWIGSPQGSQFFRSLGAVAHDIGHGTSTFNDLMAQLEDQRRQMLQDAWMRQQQDRARMQWKQEDAQTQRLTDWAATQGPEAQVDPGSAYRSYMTANAPLTRDQRNDNERQDRALEETIRHDRAVEARTGMGGASALGAPDAQTVEPFAWVMAMGGTLPPGYRTDRQLARAVAVRAAQIRADQHLSPQTFAVAQSAFRGNQHALQTLSDQRARIGVAEDTALRNLQLARQLSGRVPRTSIPLINQALLANRANIEGDPATVQFYNAIITARAEYAKVLSGNTSAAGITDSARREADELIRPDMTPQQIDAVINTAQTEMANRMGSFDDMIGGVSNALSQGQFMSGDARAPVAAPTPPGANAPAPGQTPPRPRNVPPNAVWNGQMWVLPR